MKAKLLFFLPVALLLCLIPPAGAGAAYEPLGSSTTTIALAKPFASFLKTNGIKLSAVAPAQVRGAKLSLPLAEGKWDPTIGKGQIQSAGAIVFAKGARKLPLKDLTVKANRNPLAAKVGGGQLKLATSKAIASRQAGFGSSFQAKQLLLTAKAATRLNKKLRPKVPFRVGQVLGTLKATSQPALIDVLPEGRLGLDPDPGFLAKLSSLFVSLNPVFPAERPGPFTFPIAAASTISPDGTQGTIRTEGELEMLLLGSGQLFWGEQWLDLWGGADLVNQYLAAGLLDELELHVVPILLGGGARLFENLGDSGVKLEQVRAVEAPGVAHLKYRVVRGS